MIANVVIEALNGGIEIEKHGPFAVVADHALNPEERADTGAAGHRTHMMEAGGGIKNHVPGGQLHLMGAIGVFYDQLAAVVLVRIAEEQRSGKVRANPVSGSVH